MNLMICLADIVPPAPPPGTGDWLQVMLYVVGIMFFLIKGVSEAKALFGRKPPIDHVLAGLATVPQLKEVDARLDGLKTEVHNRLREMSEYNHNGFHDLAGKVQALQLSAQERHESLKETIVENFKELDEKRSRSVGVAHSQVNELRDRVSAVEAQSTAMTQNFHQLDAKLDGLKNLLMEAAGRRRSA